MNTGIEHEQRVKTAEYYEGEIQSAFDDGIIDDYVLNETLDFGVDFVMRFDDGKPEYRAAVATLDTGGPGVYLDTYEGRITVADMGGKSSIFLRKDVLDALDNSYREIFEVNMQAMASAQARR